MLHITRKTEKTHHKALTAELAVGLMMFSVFFTTAVQASDITADSVIKLVNKARTSANVAALAKNDLLQKAAEKKAQDMLDQDYFAHVSPAGKTPWDFIETVGYDYSYAGENLAINYSNAKDQQQAWMDSELHRKNILNPNYEEIGIAVKTGKIDGHMTTVTVQEFGTKMPRIATISPATSGESQSKANVAGSQVSITGPVAALGTISKNIDTKAFFKNNPMTTIGWLSAMGIALLMIVVDVAALIHKRHAQLFILHDARKNS